MRFYKLEGKTSGENFFAKNDDTGAKMEQARKISLMSNTYNQKLKQKAFLYVAKASETTVTIGIILREALSLEKLIEDYLKVIAFEPENMRLEEVTLRAERSLLLCACRNGFIEDDDVVLEQYDLDRLCHSYGDFEFGESILEEQDRAHLYAEADRYLVREELVPELDRIYAGKPCAKVTGHPVHYMVQTDDSETRESIYSLILQALYANSRLQNKRYCYLDFMPGYEVSTAMYDCLYKSNIGGAVVVRYLADDDSEDDCASGGREIIERLCEMMKKYRNQVLTVFCLPRECADTKDIFYENLGSTSIVELKEEFVSGERAERFLKMLAKGNSVRPDKKLFAKLEADKGYLAPDLHLLFDEWYDSKLKTTIYPQYKDTVTVKRKIVKAAPKGSAYDELMEMVGLAEAKKVIVQALNYRKAQKIFAEKGMKTDKPTMHMVFTGNPGTAKTTVARLFARILRENNLLSKGKLIEVGRGDLVGKYVGWTAPMIQKKFEAARGSVLFIDEAYSLADDRDGSFGDEAINTIVQEMENHREDVVVIFAGYPDKMEGFLQKNPGLRSRIAYHVPFADYSTDELCEIADLIASKKGLKLSDTAREKLESVFAAARSESDFGNGRYARNVIEKAKMAQATRLLGMEYDSIRSSDIATICAEDIEIPAAKKKESRQIGFCN